MESLMEGEGEGGRGELGDGELDGGREGEGLAFREERLELEAWASRLKPWSLKGQASRH